MAGYWALNLDFLKASNLVEMMAGCWVPTMGFQMALNWAEMTAFLVK